VGAAANIVLYFVYLLITAMGVPPKLAMTSLYFIGVLLTFVLNRNWSFEDGTPGRLALLRYCVVYGSGYLLNFAILAIFVDALKLPHQYVQGVAIVTLALYLFGLQKTWVFRSAGPTAAETGPTRA